MAFFEKFVCACRAAAVAGAHRPQQRQLTVNILRGAGHDSASRQHLYNDRLE